MPSRTSHATPSNFAQGLKDAGIKCSTDEDTSRVLSNVAYRIVQNSLRNVLIVTDAAGSKIIKPEHFVAASTIVDRSLELLRKKQQRSSAKKGGQTGGAIVLPSEYFGAPANPAYSSAGYAGAEQSALPTTEWGRPAMQLYNPYAEAGAQTGGADASALRAAVSKILTTVKEAEGRKEIKLSSEAVDLLTEVVKMNIKLVINYARQLQRSSKGKVSKDAIVQLMELPQFRFLAKA